MRPETQLGVGIVAAWLGLCVVVIGDAINRDGVSAVLIVAGLLLAGAGCGQVIATAI